jgi:hypothetical protein
LPSLPPDLVAVPASQMRGERVQAICRASMAWCERVWVSGSRQGLIAVAGTQPLDQAKVSGASKAQFMEGLKSIPDQIKSLYPTRGATVQASIEQIPRNLFAERVTVKFSDAGGTRTDERFYFFFRPECRLDLLLSGPSREVTDLVRQLGPALERYKEELRNLFPSGLPLKKSENFNLSNVAMQTGIWLAALLLGMFGVSLLSDVSYRVPLLKAYLGALLVVFLALNAALVVGMYRCDALGGGACSPGIPASFDFLVLAVLIVGTLTAGIVARDLKMPAGIVAFVAIHQAALGVHGARAGGALTGVLSNAVLTLLSVLVIWAARRSA